MWAELRAPRPRTPAGRAVAAGMRAARVDRFQASGAAVAGGARQSISAVMAMANAEGKSHGSHSWLEARMPRRGGACASGARATTPRSWHARSGADMCLPGCSVAPNAEARTGHRQVSSGSRGAGIGIFRICRRARCLRAHPFPRGEGYHFGIGRCGRLGVPVFAGLLVRVGCWQQGFSSSASL